jgi:hypothetical protein
VKKRLDDHPGPNLRASPVCEPIKFNPNAVAQQRTVNGVAYTFCGCGLPWAQCTAGCKHDDEAKP